MVLLLDHPRCVGIHPIDLEEEQLDIKVVDVSNEVLFRI